jgi:superoxide reductase
MKLGDQVQTADWKKEKHVPVIECPDAVTAGEPFTVNVSVGKEIAHPNTTEHHISWIDVFFQPEKGFTYHVGRYEFWGHGQSTKGPNEGPVYTHPDVTFSMHITESGALITLAFCNIHGLWEDSKAIAVSG